jgi:predicted small secreted protein
MRMVLGLLVGFAALSIAACNTVAGMGQDTNAVSQAANGAK